VVGLCAVTLGPYNGPAIEALVASRTLWEPNIDQGHIVYYRANKNDCSICSLKPKCTTAAMRKVTRDVDEDVRDRVRALADTETFQQSRRERKKIEMRFAHMKRIPRLDRLRLRGLRGRFETRC
jgi:hypothetical protein